MSNEMLTGDALATLILEAVDCLPNGFSILDANLRPLLANRVSREAFADFNTAIEGGASKEEAVYRTVRRAEPNASEAECRTRAASILKSIANGKSFDIKALNGRTYKVTHTPMSSGRFVGVAVDVTELRQREEELEISRRQAETANDAKSSFLANMSHEIRTPLNGILGMAQVLMRSAMRQEQREQVDVILESAKMLKALLDDVLDFSKIEAGRMELAPVDQDLRQILLRQQWLWRPRAEEKGISLRLEIEDDVPNFLRLDPTRLSQCISNLVSNAIKFTKRGEVCVRVSSKEKPCGVELSIAVSDSGIGMTRDTIGRLFAPFTQADGSISRRFGGTGLGLVITRKLARAMGGDIEVKSEPDKGSVFTLTIVTQFAEAAVAAPQAHGEQLAHAPRRMDNRGRRILLVDDHPLNRRVARMFLAPEGYIVTEAEEGQQALDRLSEQEFDLVLLDMHMPVLDGIETLKRIRASDQPWHNVPVIALTADAMSGDRERYLAEGMNGYLAKPIEQRDLMSEISRLLDTPRPLQSDAPAHQTYAVPPPVSAKLPRPISDAELDALLADMADASPLRPSPASGNR